MWKPVDLRFDYNLMKGGLLDDISIYELKDIIDSHRIEFEKVKVHMPATLLGECNESLDALEKFYKLRLSKGSHAKGPKAQKLIEQAAISKKLTPTMKYKEIFGTPPASDYRSQFGTFDKKAYAKWLVEQVKQAEDKAK